VVRVDPVTTPDVGPLLSLLGVDLSEEHLRRALTHSSHAYENVGGENNERLEFLGDAVLGQSVTWLLFDTYPNIPEGELAKRRATVVSTGALAEVAKSLNLGDYLLLGRGEELTGGRTKASLLADALEAVIGVVFATLGADTAHRLVARLWGEMVANEDTFSVNHDPKTALQEWAAGHRVGPPEYDISESGPDHEKVFTARVLVPGWTGNGDPRTPLAEGRGSSKKNAEIDAARNALDQVHSR
jgi:ribonuclease III